MRPSQRRREKRPTTGQNGEGVRNPLRITSFLINQCGRVKDDRVRDWNRSNIQAGAAYVAIDRRNKTLIVSGVGTMAREIMQFGRADHHVNEFYITCFLYRLLVESPTSQV